MNTLKVLSHQCLCLGYPKINISSPQVPVCHVTRSLVFLFVKFFCVVCKKEDCWARWNNETEKCIFQKNKQTHEHTLYLMLEWKMTFSHVLCSDPELWHHQQARARKLRSRLPGEEHHFEWWGMEKCGAVNVVVRVHEGSNKNVFLFICSCKFINLTSNQPLKFSSQLWITLKRV